MRLACRFVLLTHTTLSPEPNPTATEYVVYRKRAQGTWEMRENWHWSVAQYVLIAKLPNSEWRNRVIACASSHSASLDENEIISAAAAAVSKSRSSYNTLWSSDDNDMCHPDKHFHNFLNSVASNYTFRHIFNFRRSFAQRFFCSSSFPFHSLAWRSLDFAFVFSSSY